MAWGLFHIRDKMIASIDTVTLQCTCCARTNMSKSVKIFFRGATYNLGVSCAGKWFGLNMSGNPFKAIERLNRLLLSKTNEQIDEILAGVKQAHDTH